MQPHLLQMIAIISGPKFVVYVVVENEVAWYIVPNGAWHVQMHPCFIMCNLMFFRSLSPLLLGLFVVKMLFISHIGLFLDQWRVSGMCWISRGSAYTQTVFRPQ